MASNTESSMLPLEIPGYRIVEPLGSGKLGSIYVGEQKSLGRKVAIKTVHPRLTRAPGVLEGLVKEARAAARVFHPALAAVLDAGVVGKTFYLVREYVEGESLLPAIKSREPVGEDDVLELALHVAKGLARLEEQNMVHANIKPTNIIYALDGRVVLTDFGMTRPLTTGQGTSGQELADRLLYVTDPCFVAPEWSIEAHLSDNRTDIYTLGLVLYCLLCGDLPFQGASKEVLKNQAEMPLPSLKQFNLGLSDATVSLVAGMTAKPIFDRIKSAEALLTAVEEAIQRVSRKSAGSGIQRAQAPRPAPSPAPKPVSEPQPKPIEQEPDSDQPPDEETEGVPLGAGSLTARLSKKPPSAAAPMDKRGGGKTQRRETEQLLPAVSPGGVDSEVLKSAPLEHLDEVPREEITEDTNHSATNQRVSCAAGDQVFVEVLDGASKGTRVEMKAGESIIIGRGRTCNIHVPERTVSSRHCSITRESSKLTLDDLGSHNGTRVNGRKVDEMELCHNDMIRIGKTRIRIRIQ